MAGSQVLKATTYVPMSIKRIEFCIKGADGSILREPGFVEHCGELPIAVMRAVEDFLELNEQEKALPLMIHVYAADAAASC